MILVHNPTVEEINTALLSIMNSIQNINRNINTPTSSSSSSETNDVGICILYCGDVDTESTSRIEVFDGWLLCNHAEITVSDHEKLYRKIGRKFGDGDGNTTFNLPNYMNITSGAVYLIKYK